MQDHPRFVSFERTKRGSDGPCQVPVVLAPGARVGIAALSGPVDEQTLQRGVEELESMGFVVTQAPNVTLASGFLAGSDVERIEGFHELLRSDVDAILFSRGGHGVLRVIDQIDWDLLAARPRWFVGYSDLTPLLLEISKRTGWMTVHGPMVATELARGLDSAERESFLNVLMNNYDRCWDLHDAGRGAQQSPPAASVRIEGPFFGGCLAMICAALGTAYDPSPLFDDAVIFLEDVGEAPYRIDRSLTQLGLAGLGRAHAVVFGHCREYQVGPGEGVAGGEPMNPGTSGLIDEALREILADHSARLGVPVFHGVDAGHGTPNLALPLGAIAEIRRGQLRLSTKGPMFMAPGVPFDPKVTVQ